MSISAATEKKTAEIKVTSGPDVFTLVRSLFCKPGFDNRPTFKTDDPKFPEFKMIVKNVGQEDDSAHRWLLTGLWEDYVMGVYVYTNVTGMYDSETGEGVFTFTEQ